LTKALEIARRDKVIGHSLDAEVTMAAAGEWGEFIAANWEILQTVTIVSAMRREEALSGEVYAGSEIPGLQVLVRPASGSQMRAVLDAGRECRPGSGTSRHLSALFGGDWMKDRWLARHIGPLSALVGLVVADQLSKWWVRANLALYESREIIPGFFNLVHYTNTGAAFGLLAGESTAWRRLFFHRGRPWSPWCCWACSIAMSATRGECTFTPWR
jgi:hypothetical protein